MTTPTPPDDAVTGSTRRRKGFSPGSIPTRVWLALLLLVVAVLFVTQNRDTTEIRLLVMSLVAPLWVALTVAVGVGMIIGLLLGPSARRRRAAQK